MEQPAIRVDGLSKRFGTGETAVQAVENISFSIEQGSVVGLLGPNGAGKTTTIKSLLGLVVPDSGTVEIAGIDVSERPNEVYERIGVILEGARNIYWRLTVRENLEFFTGLGGSAPREKRERHDKLLEKFNLTDAADTVVNELSRGMKQKVSLATTLARDVDVIFLDEPTLGLDIETAFELRAELNELSEAENVTIVLCSHDMDVIEEVCDDVLIMNDGRIATFDSVEKLLELSRSRAYELTVQRPATDLRKRLEQSTGVTCAVNEHRLKITVRGAQGIGLAETITLIQAADAEIHTIRTLEPDLEEVFLRVVGSDSVAAGTETDTARAGLVESAPKTTATNGPTSATAEDGTQR